MALQNAQQPRAAHLVPGGCWGASCGQGVQVHLRPLCENARRVFIATAAAACAGVLVGLLRGGRIERLAQLQIRLGLVAGLAWLVQVILFVSPLASAIDSWAAPVHLASIALLALVILANRALPGVALLGVGLLLNASVYAANGGFMPVSETALVASGNAASVQPMSGGARFQKTILQQPDTPLWYLGDVLPLPVVGKIYSVGDVVAAVGLFVLIVGGMAEQRQPHAARA